jgi:hypothetical protein
MCSSILFSTAVRYRRALESSSNFAITRLISAEVMKGEQISKCRFAESTTLFRCCRPSLETSCIRLSSYPECQQFSVWRDVRTGYEADPSRAATRRSIRRNGLRVALRNRRADQCLRTGAREGATQSRTPAPPPCNASARPGKRCARSRPGRAAGRPRSALKYSWAEDHER